MNCTGCINEKIDCWHCTRDGEREDYYETEEDLEEEEIQREMDEIDKILKEKEASR